MATDNRFQVIMRNGDRYGIVADTYVIESSTGIITFQEVDSRYSLMVRLSEVLFISGPHQQGDGHEVLKLPPLV